MTLKAYSSLFNLVSYQINQANNNPGLYNHRNIMTGMRRYIKIDVTTQKTID